VRTLVLLLLFQRFASADEPFRYDWRIDASATVVGLWLWMSSEVAKHELVQPNCNWCERDAAGHPTVNGFDGAARDALRWSDTSTAESLSNALGYVVPALVLGSGLLAAGVDHRLKEFPVDLLLVAESAVMAADVNQVVKFSVARERPLVHFTDSIEARRSVAQADALTSFYSGHATLAFALATAAGTIAQRRHYRLAPLIWALGMTLAATTAYLRVAADRHYLTDVLVGGGIGSLVGFLNPFVIHAPTKRRLRASVSTASDRLVIGVVGTF
jgi:membrane-associated phospholipid phosphatase